MATAEKKEKDLTSSKKMSSKQVFVCGLLLMTLLFGYMLADYFILEPMRSAGKPVYGDRLSSLGVIKEEVIEQVQLSGNAQEGVKQTVISVKGPNIYVSLTVEEGVSLNDARTKAEQVASELVTQTGDSINSYSMQLVVSSGDTETLLTTNREAEEAQIKAHDLSIVEAIVSHTERYPTAENMQRSQANIDLMMKSYPEEAVVFQNRIDNLTEYTAEQEEALGDIPILTVERAIPRTTISDYPNWGTFDLSTLTFHWN